MVGYIPAHKIETPRRKVTVVNVQLQNRVANCRDAQGGETTASWATTMGPFASVPAQGEQWYITLVQSNWMFERKTDYQNPSLTAVSNEGDLGCVVSGEITLTDNTGTYYNRPQTDAAIAASRFTGEVIMWLTASAPTGWLLLDGSAKSRTTYASLFALYGTTFGVGDGSTTFNLPNMEHRVAVGYDSTQTEFNTLGKTGGEKTHTLSTSEMPSHSHTPIVSQDGGVTNRGAAMAGTSSQLVRNDALSTYTLAGNIYPLVIEDTGGGTAHNNLQPYLTVNYIVKT
jgi:microcystin-dependent protein